MSTGLLLALACGAPAVADDTELLLVNPNAATQTIPNVLFIIDSSGSMSTEEETREVYDYNLTYVGGTEACDPNYLYWTRNKKILPLCESGNTKKILKTSFLCNDSVKQIQGIGSYRNKMVQYRDGGSGFYSIFLGLDSTRWQNLEDGNDSDIVECRKDRGKHGDGANLDDLFAQRGGDVAPYTNDNDEEVAWNSWPTSDTITVYDGNFLNYLENPVLVMDSRINIVNNTAKAILNAIEGINVGIMRFNNNQGGPVIVGMKDLDSNRAAIIDTIDDITAGGATPVSEAMYEAARYWRGLPAFYGETVNEHTTDPVALESDNPEVYQQPSSQVCSKNFTVLLTDGEPVNDEETPSLVDSLPNWFATHGYAGCTGTNMGDCLDDVAAYLNKDDISTAAGAQIVTTHTIAFGQEFPYLENTAARGGGDYFRADDVQSLTQALLEIVTEITEDSLSFAAPAVAVNTFNRTQNLNDLYLSTFAASQQYRWPGNLKKYRIKDGIVVDKNENPAINQATGLFDDNATSFWSSSADGDDVRTGGALENLPDPAVRKLYTNNTSDINLAAAANALAPSNDGNFSLSDFGLTGADGEPTIEELIRWARGEDLLDEDFDPDTTVRKAMGDPLHSQPAAVSYGGTPTNPDMTLYTATNDGYLHAINSTTGRELWAFVPKELLPRLPSLFFNPDSADKQYGIDGDIVSVMADRDNDGVVEQADGDFVYIIFGMRRGGNAYYALDVTDRNNPKLKWRISVAGAGQSWSRPTVARIDIDDPDLNSDKAVVVLGGGYDTVHDTITHPASEDTEGAGVAFLDLQTGDILWRAGTDSGADLVVTDTGREMDRSIATQVRVIDINGDRLADRMYAADMGGQILRFDITNGETPDNLVAGGVVAQLGAEGLSSPTLADTRRFYTSPDVSVFTDNIQDRRFLAISIGSGYRSHPLEDSIVDRFYSIRDVNVFTAMTQAQFDAFVPVTDAELIEISGTTGQVIPASKRGWKFTLPADQKVLSNSVTFNNEIFFVGFSPDAAGAAACSAGTGQNFLYRVSVVNGDPIGDLSAIAPGQEDAARSTVLKQGGIAPSPAFLFPSPDDPDCTGEECSPPPVGCIGVECFDPGFQNFPVRTLWTQDGIE